jgi:hypothetical protein
MWRVNNIAALVLVALLPLPGSGQVAVKPGSDLNIREVGVLPQFEMCNGSRDARPAELNDSVPRVLTSIPRAEPAARLACACFVPANATRICGRLREDAIGFRQETLRTPITSAPSLAQT